MIEKLRTFCMKREGHRSGALGGSQWLGPPLQTAAEYIELTRILAEIRAPRDRRIGVRGRVSAKSRHPRAGYHAGGPGLRGEEAGRQHRGPKDRRKPDLASAGPVAAAIIEEEKCRSSR
jgi:hypothetical protein